MCKKEGKKCEKKTEEIYEAKKHRRITQKEQIGLYQIIATGKYSTTVQIARDQVRESE